MKKGAQTGIYRIVAHDNEATVLLGIRVVLQELFATSTVIECRTEDEVLANIKSNQIDLAVIGISQINGDKTDLIRTLKMINSDLLIIALLPIPNFSYSKHYFALNLNGYLSKLDSIEILTQATNAVMGNTSFISESLKSEIVRNALSFSSTRAHSTKNLTERELLIARMMAQGKKTNEIARTLVRRTSTISTQKRKIFNKLSVENIVDLRTIVGV